ncbi:TIGR02452 family protein [Lysinibacillus xylanilyticus]|uniref:TIGR02452 family protein n=1 Tax=Lysinibacillus xylanilyticus TaxID=582475 RepID=UPI003D04E5A2
MNRKEIAKETLRIQEQGYYIYDNERMDFAETQKFSEDNSELIVPKQGDDIVQEYLKLPKLQKRPVYSVNNSMMYTNHVIYSPDVVFFRDERFTLMKQLVTASVLTLPAVNYGQVVLMGEDCEEAERVMKDRMRLALAIFAQKGAKHLILGAYGCGVFRNDPVKIATW